MFIKFNFPKFKGGTFLFDSTVTDKVILGLATVLCNLDSLLQDSKSGKYCSNVSSTINKRPVQNMEFTGY